MSAESQDFLTLREGEYARASVGVEPIEPEREDENWPIGFCWCCRSKKPIPHELGHCLECDELLANL